MTKVGRPKRAPTREVKISDDLATYLEDLGKVWGLRLRDMVDAVVGDFYIHAKKSEDFRTRVIQGHIARTDAKTNYRYLDARGLSKMRARRDRELREAGVERDVPAASAVPDWLK